MRARWIWKYAVLLCLLSIFFVSCDDFVLYDVIKHQQREVEELQISPTSISLTVNGNVAFSVDGGTKPYSFSLDSGSGMIDSVTGLYAAPVMACTDTVWVTDSRGISTSATVTVSTTALLGISPTSIAVPVNGHVNISAIGGVPSYGFSIVSGGGSINATTGAFTAPATADIVTIRVTDSDVPGSTSDATVTVVPLGVLTISPPSLYLLVNNNFTFSTFSGVTPYSYSLIAGSGTVDPNTGLYTAPSSPGACTVRVTDSDTPSSTDDATVTFFLPLVISPSAVTHTVNGSQTFTGSGGVAPLSYSIVFGAGSVHPTTGAYTAGSSPGTDVLRVADSIGNISESIITVVPSGPLSISPSATTLSLGGNITFMASGGTTPYTYSILSGYGTINSSTGVYVAPLIASSNVVRVTDSVGSTNDAVVTVTWDIDTVYSAGDVGKFASLSLDMSGRPCISYYDGTTRDLAYASWNGMGWDSETVDGAANVGEYTSLALDGSGNPRISYYDSSNKDLKYVSWDGFSWDIQTVDGAADVGKYTSLALDGSGNPKISYYENSNRDLKYASWNGTSWDIQTVDSAADVGEYTSLALDGSGNPRISYYDSSTKDLKYVSWDGSSWDIQTVDGAADVGKYTSLALDGSGNPKISYYANSNRDLKYASWNGSSWDIEIVDGAADVGEYTALLLDGTGYPRISYYDSSNRDVKYASWDGSIWEIQTVDGAAEVGQHTSLALDTSGRPRIIYYNNSSKDLMYAD